MKKIMFPLRSSSAPVYIILWLAMIFIGVSPSYAQQNSINDNLPGSKDLTTSVAVENWQGTWKSLIDGGLFTFEFTQNDAKIIGTFKVIFQMPTGSGGSQTMSNKGTVNAAVSGNRLTGTLTFDGEPEPDLSYEFDMSPDAQSFSGQMIDLEDGDRKQVTFTRADAPK